MGRVKLGLRIDTLLSTKNTLHGSGRSGILLQIEKEPKTSGGDLKWYVISLDDAVAHLSVTDPSQVLTIEK